MAAWVERREEAHLLRQIKYRQHRQHPRPAAAEVIGPFGRRTIAHDIVPLAK
jgi:hypothetical protein